MISRSLAVATRLAAHTLRVTTTLTRQACLRTTLRWQAFRELNGRRVALGAVGPGAIAVAAVAGTFMIQAPAPAVHHTRPHVAAAGPGPSLAFGLSASPHTPAPTPGPSVINPAAVHPAAPPGTLAAVRPPRPTPRPSASPQPTASTPPPQTSPPPSPAPPPPSPSPPPAPAPTGSPKAYALSVLGSVQYGCIDQIFIRESGWRVDATNPNSGAYGIPQALPGSKMASAGPDWATNGVTQVKWAIGYVDSVYGSACDAWAFWRSHSWY